MPKTQCANANYLESALALYQVRGQLTRNQAYSIKEICRQTLPADVEILQRMPKGATYVHVNGTPFAEITNRAKSYRVNT